MVRRGKAGEAWRGREWRGGARQAWQGVAWPGRAWIGKARQARRGVARQGLAGPGMAGQAWHGMAGHGTVRQGLARQAWAGMAWPGMARQAIFLTHRRRRNDMTKEQRNAIRDTLERITQANSGRLTPEDVVQEAKSKDSPLHDCFEWDQRKAAHQYRIWQARELITSIKVEVRTDKTTLSTVAYVRDPTAGPREQGYVRTLSIVGETEMARDVLLEEFGRARAALQRANDLASVFQLQEEIGLVSERIEHMRVRVSQEAHA